MEATRALAIRGPYRAPSGHGHHTREFVRALARAGVRVQLLDLPGWGPLTLPPGQRDPWFDSLEQPVGARALLHFCMPHQVLPIPGLLAVNYTMFEATRIPAAWASLGRQHDLVILPTVACREAWVASGVPDERLRLCPLGVDPERFHPDVAPLELADRQGKPVRDYRTRVLNVSEIGPRKNLLALLRVWIATTRRDDHAILLVKLTRAAPDGPVRLMRDLALAERALGRTREDAAPVLFLDRLFSDAEMPRLFAAATHYWSMSHGEGWDQPMMEAAATGLRLIAPRHSAYTTYLDEASATLLPARRVPVSFGDDPALLRLFEGAEWWEPDEGAAAAAIREAVTGVGAAGAGARGRVAAEFSWDRAAARLIEILAELHARHGLPF